jgi:catechol 2,3-dioxygenase-like lactoylglutathione lyase family enzyme
MSFTISGLNHLGLVVPDIAIAKAWFIDALGFKVLEDRGELLFLQVGNSKDILAIKTPRMAVNKPEHGGEGKIAEITQGLQHLDHYGFFAKSRAEVDDFAEFLKSHQVEILKGPYDRSDGRSVYFRDPLGLVGEYLYWEEKTK